MYNIIYSTITPRNFEVAYIEMIHVCYICQFFLMYIILYNLYRNSTYYKVSTISF